MKGVYFVTGIDTDIGKTIATGVIARRLMDDGVSVITQKLVQTGNATISDDIVKHRELMSVALMPDDLPNQDGVRLTMPLLLSYPASPHLASRLDGVAVDLDQIAACTDELAKRYQVVLLEGAGGVMVPLLDNEQNNGQGDVLTIDHIAAHDYPVIVVTSGRLGSINHTLLTLDILKNKGIIIHAIAYNLADDSQDTVIATDSKRYLQNYLHKYHPQTQWWEIPVVA
ncbi:dethiobiotin synthase [Moraxella sp. FZLJ2107]|uniref:dethiobiotin synthase n=1 Tax=unclassified Moraxella TaxID=2685852 RepID=UPI00209C1C72|nr:MULTISPECIES: dethiobiotin synthase [unclassified Moraxella]USZ15551.1 dethiobiotin synthase [Moraxella sp. FZFQ2102]UTO04628.1 dethiobiotin synthase [Moraxella sp. FZLJ2107]UTO21356.1 dethiobiotin synthase [Moraxella sp. FZLJ2109]